MNRITPQEKNVPISVIVLILIFFLVGCINPVEPEFEFKDDIIFVDAYALTEAGASSVSIRRSVLIKERFYTEGVSNASVNLMNNNGVSISFTEGVSGLYVSPKDFAAEVGETWQLFIQLENGKRYESEEETVSSGVPIDNISASYSDELLYLESEKKFVPGHAISIDWNDPSEERNYYLWKYKTYEPLVVCQSCEKGRYRNGECLTESQFRFRHFDYLCDNQCWLIRFGENFQIFDDRLVDGQKVTNFPIADLPFYRRQDILIEIQQLSLSKSAYDYFNIINDIFEKSSGLNAPPPAALLGNLYNPDDPDETILGQFSATSSETLTLFISRSNLGISPIDPDPSPALEDTSNPDHLISLPCMENPFRTSDRPNGWQ